MESKLGKLFFCCFNQRQPFLFTEFHTTISSISSVINIIRYHYKSDAQKSIPMSLLCAENKGIIASKWHSGIRNH
ncbi:hypothetical protein FLL65_05590 [Vibrio cholerae]|uniref:Uncharacterized protein n=1 Tax=Vibrio cholerae TaxID=666 RepID=A0A544BL84_VIBCL|nr:hypothetical protein FLM08_13335 [Vibrio cholerae]TQP07123.1 hypothetical protein FLL97_00610 [Vibrio cholerae]TQP17645.1 hypothetical protein FLM02_02180 [Vibrio cholerae]TQP82831.1 hypothetical protein FLL74_18940 [Vibrio cholerae]TQQ50408.1 hypothetical protein FLL65_05590 [Vibrio cholerae]